MKSSLSSQTLFKSVEEAEMMAKRKWHQRLLREASCNIGIVENKCFSCGEIVKHRKLCTGCRQVVFYCNKSCQKDHWKVHKVECKKPANPTEKAPMIICQDDLGFNPTREKIDAAVKEYERKAALGLRGGDNPMITFKDEHGKSKYLFMFEHFSEMLPRAR
jgi:hypothetical protein